MKGFIKVSTMSPLVYLGDVTTNEWHMENCYQSRPHAWKSDVIVFPELGLTGNVGDLFLHDGLMNMNVELALSKLCQFQRGNEESPTFIVGAPIEYNGQLYNCAVVMTKGDIIGVVPKCYLDAQETRWFTSGISIKDKELILLNQSVPFGSNLIFDANGKFKFGIEVGSDLNAPIPPSTFLALAGAEVIFNTGSSHEEVGKNDELKSIIANQSLKCHCGYVYASSGYGESSMDKVYIPKSFIYEDGELVSQINTAECFNTPDSYKLLVNDIDLNRIRLVRRKSTSFKDQSIVEGYSTKVINHSVEMDELNRHYSRYCFDTNEKALEEMFNIQVTGLMRRLFVTSGKVVLGVSGGSDSTLALLVAYEAMMRLSNKVTDIHGITMPCYGTTDRTKNNSLDIMNTLGITSKRIMIASSVTQHRKDIGLPKDDRSVTYENCQARERTQVLMDYANMVGGIVLGTGDLSEAALGWCTYNADHMSMYNVNAGVPKTLVKAIIGWYAQNKSDEKLRAILMDILATPVSPELLPDQVTEDTVGPYDLHDFFLYHIMKSGWDAKTMLTIADRTFDEFNAATIAKWFNTFHKRFMTQQFKRSCSPDGPKVTSISLSPRGEWSMPSDIEYVKIK